MPETSQERNLVSPVTNAVLERAWKLTDEDPLYFKYPARHRKSNVLRCYLGFMREGELHMGDIGKKEGQREVEFEPLPEHPMPEPDRTPQREPEKIPADR